MGVVVVDNTRDGLSVVSRVLSHQQNLNSVSFLTYGQAGQIELGSTTINAATLMADSTQVAQWGDALGAKGQILFWGCDVGQGGAGQALVDDLHMLTGAGVAASTDATGLGPMGGDWTLERTAGLDGNAVDNPFSATAEADYDSVLDAPTATVSITNASSTSNLLGNAFSQNITFSNSAANGVGYAPFVEIFAPTNATQDTPLTSVTYLGQSLSTRAVTLVNVDGTVGAYNPYSSGTDGKPQFVAAPAGFKAGDTMYVVSLPFGSYTPGQPALTLTANFANNTTESVDAPTGAGAPVTIAAAGGYQYGADALNDPGTDPTIQGAIVTNQVEQNIVQVTAGVITSPRGEDEVPTGPDYPATYEVTVTPAEVTQDNAIRNVTLNVTLPDSVNYANSLITLTGADGSTISGTATYVPPADGSTEGGSVKITLDSVAYSAHAPYKIDIPVYVGQTDAAGNSILDASGGTTSATTIAGGTVSYTGSWTPPVASGGTATPVTLDQTVDTSPTTFNAKAFAVQETDTVTNADGSATGLANGQVMPGDTITHDIHIENSDYYSSTGMVVSTTLSDGQALQPGTNPTFTYTDATGTSHSVQLGSAYWSATPGENGQTVVKMNIAQYLVDNNLPAMGAGRQGTISYASTVLDDYTASKTPVTEDNTISSSVSVSAQATGPDGTTSQVSDDSSSTLSVPSGATGLKIVAINGIAVDGADPVIHAGDAVTYEATYALQTGTYSDLDLSSYLPLPLYDTSNPTGTGASAFTVASSTALSDQQAGTYSVVSVPGDVDPGQVTVSTQSSTNSISFDMGSSNTPAATDAGKQVAVLFTLKATSSPFADGLSLTSQEQSTFTNGKNGQTAQSILYQSALQSITVGEPAAVIKTGVVSVMDGASADASVTYTPQATGEGTDTDPTTTFNAAGSDGGAYASVPTGGVSGLGAVNDLNATGAEGGDTVRIASTVENTGSAGMYDLTVSGSLPAGFSTADVRNFQITRPDGTVVYSAADASTAASSYFTTDGLTIPATSATAAVLAKGQDLTITYDLALPSAQNLGDTLVAGATVVNFGNSPGAVGQGNGFVTNGVPLGGQASDLTDPASMTLLAPTISKSISASNLPENDGVDESASSSGTIVSGETRTTTITVGVPEGTLTNGSGDVTVVETLPAGMDYAGSFSGTLNGVTASSVDPATGSLPAPTAVRNQDGTTTLTFDLGRTVTNNSGAPGTITLAYNGYYGENNAPGDSAQITSKAVLNYTVHDDTDTVARQAGPAEVTVTERKPALTETITDDTNGQALYSGQKVTYTVTLSNNSDVTAYDIAHAITLPSDLRDVSITAAGVTASVADGTTSVSLPTLASLGPADASVTYTITGTVASNLPAGTPLKVTDNYTWHSAPQADVLADSSGSSSGSGRPADVPEDYTATVSDAPKVGTFASVLDIVGEQNGTTNGVSATSPVTAADTVPGDRVTLQGAVSIPKGQNQDVVLTLKVPDNVQLDPASLSLLLASQSGQITSSTLGDALQFTEGTTPALSMQAGGKTFTLTQAAQDALNSAGAAITGTTTDASGQTVLTINLGTVTNNDPSSVPNYAIIEVAGTVLNTAANRDGNPALRESLSASTSQISTTASTVSETVREPGVTLGKAVTAIDYKDDTVTFTDTLTNTGDATAYDVALDDPLLTQQESLDGAITATGAGTVDTTINSSGSVAAQSGGAIVTNGLTLGVGASETVTYTVKLSDLTQGLAQTTTDVTWESLGNATPATSGGTEQSRDGSAGPDGAAPGATNSADTYERSVTMGLGTLSGQIWQALGNTPGTYDSVIDTALDGVGVTVTARGQDGTYATGLVQSGIATDGSGDYAALVPVYGTPTSSIAEITVPTQGGKDGLPASETEVYNRDGAATAATTAINADADSTTGMSATHADLAYELPDTAPVITGWQDTTAPHVTTAGTATAIGDGTVTVDDHELDTLTTKESSTYTYAGTMLTVQRYVDGKATPSATDSFGAQAGSGVTMADGQVSVNGIAIGSYTDRGGVLQVTFNDAATKTSIATLAQDLTYTCTPTATNPATQLDVTLGATFSDGNTSLAGQQVATGAQGTGGVQTSAPMFTRVSVGGSSFATTFTEPNDTPAAAAATDLGSYVSVEDASGTGNGSIQKVTIQINAAMAEDVLAATTAGGITASMDSATGTLTLTAGTATTLQNWQSTLASLKYYDSSDTPLEGARNVSISVFENGGAAPIVTNGTITVTAANDSPVLDPSKPVSLNDAQEDSGPPQGAVGTSVSQLAGYAGATDGAGNVTDPDGAGLTGQSPAGSTSLPGIAITGADTTHGIWWYSTDNGRTWAEFAGSGASTAVGSGNALHLIDNGQARIYFQSTDPNWNGGVNNALTFRAWDQFDGAANGSISALPATAGLGTGANTAGSAYSAAVDSVALMDDNVNDAPNVVANNSDPGATPVTGNQPASWTVAEDTPQATTVQGLFGSYFSDQTDQQKSATNPDGSIANTMAGVAVIGYKPSAAGTWAYSTDGGKTWTQLSASVSTTNALVLSTDAQLQFTPAANYNGQPLSGDDLKVVLIDNSGASSGSPTLVGTNGQALTTADGTPLTGAALDSGTMAVAGADVSTRGGQTALSVGTVDLSTAVTPVNDPPTMASGPYTLPDVTSNSGDSANTGTTIASLYPNAVQDGVDAQQSTADPTGSTADHLAGVAITGNTANPATEGTWQYSTDGGKTWTDVPANVSGSNAVVLGDQATLRFDPVPNFTGTPGGLTTQVVETSSDVPLTGSSNGVATSVTGQALDGTATALTGVDITQMQKDHPNGSVSTNSQPLDVTVTPDSHANVSIPPGQEDQPGTKETVSQLFTTTDPNGVGGVAITGNATPANEGTWMYSVPGGTAHALPTDLTTTNAVVLPKDAQIWFQPAPNFNGDPSNISLTATVIDNTTATAFTGADGRAVVGDAITGATTGVDASNTGGGTALDVVPVQVNTSVAQVNDAPVASGSATLPSADTNSQQVRGDSVSSLFGPTFSDQADQQRSASNPGGSVADQLQGIAIVGNAANPATQGTWQYSTDGGVTWQNVSTSVSATAALVLPASAEMHFAPVIGFTGTPGGLSAALVETNSTLATGTTAQVADVSAMMADETSHVSQTTVVLNTNVTQQEGNPALSGSTLNNDLSSSDLLKTSVEDGFENEFQRGFGVAHQTWIRGTTLYRFVTTNQQYDVDVPAGAFISSDGTDLNLTITARQAGGAPLPDWVSFDADRRCFSMIAPDDATGSIDLALIGRDEYGHEAEVDVHVVIGHEHPAWQMADDPSIPQAVERAIQVVEQDMNWLAFNPDFHRGSEPAHGKKGLRAQIRQIGQRAAYARSHDLTNH
ncbi:hypothetical protein AA0616_3122 [Komagataeibacter nataicola NRIC 0616]|nr:hypothetical protein AA0616_3122 [Komagataeibacter nataicola NRIC 0616]